MILPPPSLEEIQGHTPSIGPVPEGSYRPFWSVMIPTYNSAHYLRRTLASVLAQDIGPGRMQIEVVDNCSTTDNPEAVVRELGKERVGFFRQPSNLGPTQNFNTCIERAQGRWVHILHSDDMVLPGCYEACEQAIAAYPECSMVISPVVSIDEHDCWLGVMRPLPSDGKPFLVEDFAVRQAVAQCGQFAGVFVRRDAYEKVGGFCTHFEHVVDWDMWFRIGLISPVVSLPRPFAMYRLHSASDTSRQMVTGNNITECVEMTQVNLQRFERFTRTRHPEGNGWRRRLAQFAEVSAWKLDQLGCLEGRFNQARWAWKLDPNFRRLRLYLTSWARAFLSRKRKMA
jgi:glycosyltransferase involved in cell wall biosynthesis